MRSHKEYSTISGFGCLGALIFAVLFWSFAMSLPVKVAVGWVAVTVMFIVEI